MAVSSIGCRRKGCGKLPVRARVARDPPFEGEFVIDIRIETFKDIQVARIGHVGPYADVWPCFERLFKWAASVGAPTGRVLTLSYDNPNAVAPERLRSDVCVELRTEAVPPPGIEIGPWEAVATGSTG